MRLLSATAVVLLSACLSSPDPPRPGHGTIWGTVSLVPRAGVTRGAYAGRTQRRVRLVDYSHPGFAVVYVEGLEPEARRERQLRLRSTRVGVGFEPADLVLTTGETLHIRNDTDEPQLVSIPALGVARTLAPGAAESLAVDVSGELEVFLLGARERRALLFAAPGRWARTTPDGRWELRDLPPGRHTLVTWRHRFPETRRAVEVGADLARRLDLEISVGSLREIRGASR
jgi:hypothetical protein